MDPRIPQNRFFAPGAEFARIERMFGADRFSGDGRLLGDDGVVWNPGVGNWVAVSDASVEGVHFRLDWASPDRALRKALLANLSDINAMGGRSRMALFNLGARSEWGLEVYEALGEAIRRLEAEHGFRIQGGDTTTAPHGAFFSFTVLGVVEGRPLLRSEAKAGARIYVSGSLGGSSAGLALLREHGPERAAGSPLTEAHLDPRPPLDLGPLLASMNRPDRPIAAIDISDGLSSELWHVSRQSKVRLGVDFARLPAHPALSRFSRESVRGHVLHGGEEYQLLFTGDFTTEELQRLRSICPVTEIGDVVTGDDVLLVEDGNEHPLHAGGWNHAGTHS